MNVADIIMRGDALQTYVYDRKLHRDEGRRKLQTQGLQRIIVHNAQRTEEVENFLRGVRVEAEKYFPKRSTEAHFYDPKNGDLHVVNPRGTIRLVRDEDLAWALISHLRVDFEIDHYEGSEVKATRRFQQFAYELVDEAFSHLNPEQIKDQRSIDIFIGPHSSLKLEAGEEQASQENDFLNYKILKLGDRVAISFDYIFADQAKNVLNQVYNHLSALRAQINVNVFHYGKIGILNPDLEVGQTCLPHTSLDENKVLNNDPRKSPIHNQLTLETEEASRFVKLVGEEPYQGTTVNTISVLRQTRSSLQSCLAVKGDFLDMEWAAMASLDHGANSSYPNLGKIRYYFAGVGSDKPLEEQTLGDTEFPREKERLVAGAFLEMRRSP